MPIVLPRSCSGLVMLGSTRNSDGMVGRQPSRICTGAPLTYAAVGSAPEVATNWTSPPTMLCNEVVPLLIYVTSASRPCLAKRPASAASQTGTKLLETDE